MSNEKIDRFQKLVEQNPNNELARYSLATALMAMGRFSDAEPHLDVALRLRPDWVMAYIHRARCLIEMHQHEPARELLLRGREHSLEQHHEAPVQEIDAMLAELVQP